MEMSVERCWNDTDRGKPKYLEKSLHTTSLTWADLGSKTVLHC